MHPFRLALALLLTGVLSACQLPGPVSGPGTANETVTPNAVAGDAIEVTALDDLPDDATKAAALPAEAEPAGTDTAAPQVTPPTGADPAKSAVAPETTEPAPKADLDAAPEPPKSDAERACEKKRGIWSKVGKGELRACVFMTRDSGKSCDRESDCEGVCLARSRSCSPVRPLFGCNDILQDNGSRATLCIE
jgi:hypothetical protein